MSVAVIADSHLGGPGGDSGPLLDQLAEIGRSRCERLVLLGDIFHTWVALPRFETDEHRRILDALRDLRSQGLWIAYIEGNRDFFLQESRDGLLAGAFDFVGIELAFESAGVKYLAVHGDGLNDRDWQYLAWRWLSKSVLVRVAVAMLPAAVCRRLMAGTERGLARTNFKHRQEVPRRSIETFASSRIEEGHQVVLLGHFHEAHRWLIPGGEVRLLQPWFEGRHIEWLE